MEALVDQPTSTPGVEETAGLSYDDTVPYEAQVGPSLVNRIGGTRVYLFSESSVASKRKRRDDDEDTMEEETATPEVLDESTRRPNAILLQGTPVASLPTARIFAYATHFDATPMGLEWVDDTTCILVFSSDSAAQAAMERLQRPSADASTPVLSPSNSTELMDVEAPGIDDGHEYLPARPLPIELWPPEERIAKTLGHGDGLRGSLRMRWALGGDVKKRGAKRESNFYRRHGDKAGKDMVGPFGRLHDRLGQTANTNTDASANKRQRRGGWEDVPSRVKLGEDADPHLRTKYDPWADDREPPSKMRSDYIDGGRRARSPPSNILDELKDKDGRSLLSRMNGSGTLASRVQVDDADSGESGDGRQRRSRGQRRGEDGANDSGRRNIRPKKTQQELDDELEAFLNNKS